MYDGSTTWLTFDDIFDYELSPRKYMENSKLYESSSAGKISGIEKMRCPLEIYRIYDKDL